MGSGAGVADDRVMPSILIRCPGGTDIPAAADAEAVVAGILGDMRLLGLRPAVFVADALITAESPDVQAGSYATPTLSSCA
jgi:hypothetical protein